MIILYINKEAILRQKGQYVLYGMVTEIRCKGGLAMAKELIAMLLAGGQGSRLYALTQKLAKPAGPFGGKYRIIDFPLSNCVNSGIDTVGILISPWY